MLSCASTATHCGVFMGSFVFSLRSRNLYFLCAKSKMCTPDAPGSVTMTRPCESTATLYGRTRNLKSGAPATTSTSLFQKPRLGFNSDSDLKLCSQVSLRPPSRDISHCSIGDAVLGLPAALLVDGSTATNATRNADISFLRRSRI